MCGCNNVSKLDKMIGIASHTTPHCLIHIYNIFSIYQDEWCVKCQSGGIICFNVHGKFNRGRLDSEHGAVVVERMHSSSHNPDLDKQTVLGYVNLSIPAIICSLSRSTDFNVSLLSYTCA